MNLKREFEMHLTRRQLFGLSAKGIGIAALASLFEKEGWAQGPAARDPKTGGLAEIGRAHV